MSERNRDCKYFRMNRKRPPNSSLLGYCAQLFQAVAFGWFNTSSGAALVRILHLCNFQTPAVRRLRYRFQFIGNAAVARRAEGGKYTARRAFRRRRE